MLSSAVRFGLVGLGRGRVPAGPNPSVDPYWDQVDFCANFQGTEGSTAFVDEKGHTITAVGTPIISTADYPAGALALDGSSYLTVAGLAPLGTDIFTIELFFQQLRDPATDPGVFQYSAAPGGLQPNYTNSITLINQSGPKYTTLSDLGALVGATNPIDAMLHVALVKTTDGLLSQYVNGVFDNNMPLSTDFLGTDLAIGGYYSPFYLAIGNCLGMRITPGVARYTADFIPPTSPFPITGP